MNCFVRSLLAALTCPERPNTISSSAEQALIQAHNSFTFSADCFGLPDCSSPVGLIVFDEDAIKTQSHRFHLCLLAALAPLLSDATLASFGPAHARALRQLWAVNDWAIAQVGPKVEQVTKLSHEQVVVLHEWQGRWRPTAARDHAACLVAELATDSYDVDALVYDRLHRALLGHQLMSTDVDVAGLVREARERCRLAVRDVARAMPRWGVLERKHALLARIYHYLNNVADWAELALGRFGDAGGPQTRAAELTLQEIESLVWGLRIGSFSQSSLVVPLREMEQGLERLRQAEATAAAEVADFDLDQFLVGFGDDAVASGLPAGHV